MIQVDLRIHLDATIKAKEAIDILVDDLVKNGYSREDLLHIAVYDNNMSKAKAAEAIITLMDYHNEAFAADDEIKIKTSFDSGISKFNVDPVNLIDGLYGKITHGYSDATLGWKISDKEPGLYVWDEDEWLTIEQGRECEYAFWALETLKENYNTLSIPNEKVIKKNKVKFIN